MKQPKPRAESEYKYKMVNGELVELSEDEIAELEQRDADALAKEQDNANHQTN